MAPLTRLERFVPAPPPAVLSGTTAPPRLTCLARFAAVLLVLVLAGPMAPRAQQANAEADGAAAIPGDATADATSEEIAAPDPLEEAEAAYLAADFERARELAASEIVRLEALEPAPDRDAALARALGLVVQSLYNLGRTDDLDATIDRMLAALPTHALDPAIAGPKLADRVEARRRATVGRLVVTCVPLPCEEVLVDGRAAPVDAEGRFVVIAGTHAVTLRRHGFDESVVEEVTVAPGQDVDITAQLVQIARDVRIVTEPGGVEVRIDGEVVGVTPESGDAETRVLEVLSVPPGPHVLELRKACFRKLEQKLEIVLDALDPGPLDVGTIELSPARGIVDIAWDRPKGIVALDGAPAGAGTHELCPGPHEASVTLAGRRVWFERFEISEGETVSFAPAPRPTIALIEPGAGDVLRAPVIAASWNVLSSRSEGEQDAAAAFVARVRVALEADAPPLRPQRRVAPDEALASAARDLAPEADLVALLVGLDAGARPARALVLIEPEQELVEASAWPAGDDGAAEAIARVLSPALVRAVPYAGIDLADRRNGPPVIARVDPGGPGAEAGLAAGGVILAVNGEPLALAADFETLLGSLSPPAQVSLRVSGKDAPTDVTLTVAANLAVTTPAGWRETFLLPTLARARVDRNAGTGAERLTGSLVSGMVLAALGRAEPAALALDRAGIDPALDPSGDARGTVLFVLETLFSSIANDEYAREVRARRQELDGARFGGRDGPDLRHAPAGGAR